MQENYDLIYAEKIKQNPFLILEIPKETVNYDKIAMEAIKEEPDLIEEIPKEIVNYDKIAMEAIKKDSYLIELIPSDVKNYDKIAMEAIKKASYLIEKIPKETINYDKIAMEAIKKDSYLIELIPNDVKNYDKIALEAIKKNLIIFEKIPSDVENYDKIAIEAVKLSSYIIEKIPSDVENYDKIVMAYVNTQLNNDLNNLPYLNDLTIKNIIDNISQLLSPEIKKITDKYIALYILEKLKVSNSSYIKIISDNLKDNLIFMIDAVDIDKSILQYASDDIRKDKYFDDNDYFIQSYTNINCNDFNLINCNDKDANFENMLGSCWMIALFTMFIFGDVTKNCIQKILVEQQPNEIINNSIEKLKMILDISDNLNENTLYFLEQFIEYLKEKILIKRKINIPLEKLEDKVDEIQKQLKKKFEISNYEYDKVSINFNKASNFCLSPNEDKLVIYFKNIFNKEFKEDEYGGNYKDEVSLSNLLSVLFLNKFTNMAFIYHENKTIMYKYALKQINLKDTIGFNFTIIYMPNNNDHACGFFNCNNFPKLVNNQKVITFYYNKFLDKLYELTTNNVEFIVFDHFSYDEKYYGFLIFTYDEEKVKLLQFIQDNIIELPVIKSTVKDKGKYYHFTIHNSKKKKKKIDLVEIKINMISPIKLSSKYIQPKQDENSLKKFNIIIENSIKTNDYQTFNLELKNEIKNILNIDKKTFENQNEKYLYLFRNYYEKYEEIFDQIDDASFNIETYTNDTLDIRFKQHPLMQMYANPDSYKNKYYKYKKKYLALKYKLNKKK